MRGTMSIADSIPLRRSRLAPVLKPIHEFLAAESAGGVILILAAVTALAWANSPWAHAYHDFWHTKLSIGVGNFTHAMSLEHWVNDGLMVMFFLVATKFEEQEREMGVAVS